MKPQSYHNHIFYYPPHHFFFYGAVIAGLALCSFCVYNYPEQKLLWIAFIIIIILITWLALMVRQHYALGNQNRIVRLEMRLRYYILTGKRFEVIEQQLSFKQIAALRFAPDNKLPGLIDEALNKQLSPDAIKRLIKNWLPDTMRV